LVFFIFSCFRFRKLRDKLTWIPAQAAVEVEAIVPKDPALVETIKAMNDRGITTLYGRWLIDGAPRVLLFDTGTAYDRLDEWKGDLWSVAGIPSPPGDSETNEAIVFGYLVAWFLGEVRFFGTEQELEGREANTLVASTFSTRSAGPLWFSSTSGSLAWRSRFARNGESM